MTISRHPDFVSIATAGTYGMGEDFTPDYVLSATDTLAYAERIADAEQEMTAETVSLLNSICDEVAGIAEDFEVDFSDSLADLDEILDRHGI